MKLPVVPAPTMANFVYPDMSCVCDFWVHPCFTLLYLSSFHAMGAIHVLPSPGRHPSHPHSHVYEVVRLREGGL
jgi:hypothetical protein